jgi:hypothetical protein
MTIRRASAGLADHEERRDERENRAQQPMKTHGKPLARDSNEPFKANYLVNEMYLGAG